MAALATRWISPTRRNLAGVWPYIETLIPSVGLLFLFYVVMKHLLEADRRERKANAEWDRAHGFAPPAAQAHDDQPLSSDPAADNRIS